jgi:GNAT superfamily N-acetyltransferase
VRVRLAEAVDSDTLAELRFVWRSEEEGERGRSRELFTTEFATWLRANAGTHRAFIAEDDDRALGMAWLAVVHRVPGPERFTRLAGYLQSVYVRPEVRGRGIGTALVDAVIEDAREQGLDYLAVHPSEASFSLYERAGFARNDGVLELRFTR